MTHVTFLTGLLRCMQHKDAIIEHKTWGTQSDVISSSSIRLLFYSAPAFIAVVVRMNGDRKGVGITFVA